MDVILIAGFWLDGSSWGDVADTVRSAGHSVHAPTLPGLESVDADRSGIGLQDHMDAVVATIDRIEGPVALVGHSGGGAIGWAAVDARPDRVDRIVYVDAGPLGDGDVINDELPVVDGEVPLPEWAAFEGELADFDDAGLVAFRARAIPQPVGVTRDRQHLNDDRRFDVPTVVITTTFPKAQLEEMTRAEHPYVRELARVRRVEIIELPTSHWPQFTKPAELADLLVAALR